MSYCFGIFPNPCLMFHNKATGKRSRQFHQDKPTENTFVKLPEFTAYCETFFRKLTKPPLSLVIVEGAQLRPSFYTILVKTMRRFSTITELISPFHACLLSAFYYIAKSEAVKCVQNGSKVLVCLGIDESVTWVLCQIDRYTAYPVEKGIIEAGIDLNAVRQAVSEVQAAKGADLTFFYAISPKFHAMKPEKDSMFFVFCEKLSHGVEHALLTGADAKAAILADCDAGDLFDVAATFPSLEILYPDEGRQTPVILPLETLPFTLKVANPEKKRLQILYADKLMPPTDRLLRQHKPNPITKFVTSTSVIVKMDRFSFTVEESDDPIPPSAPQVETNIVAMLTRDMAVFCKRDPETNKFNVYETSHTSGFPLFVSYASGQPVCDAKKVSEDYLDCREYVVEGFSAFIGRKKNDIGRRSNDEFKIFYHEKDGMCIEYLSGKRPNQRKVLRSAKTVFKELLVGLLNQVVGFDPTTDGVAIILSKEDYIRDQIEFIKNAAEEAGIQITDIDIGEVGITQDMFTVKAPKNTC